MFEFTNKHIYQITYHLTPIYFTENGEMKSGKIKHFTSEFKGSLCDAINMLIANTQGAMGDHILGIDYIVEKPYADEM